MLRRSHLIDAVFLALLAGCEHFTNVNIPGILINKGEIFFTDSTGHHNFITDNDARFGISTSRIDEVI
jgi:hypothetical protein